ncbi:MAG: phage major tail tube protein [Alphaproteobacteria bacterium]|nr:phage major tail tube protein [Alphaproteobacteria bacterium]
MGQVKLYSVREANLYIDGANMAGRVESVDLPDIVTKTIEKRSLSMIGAIDVPIGFEKMTGKIAFTALFEDAALKMSNPFKSVKLMLRSNIKTFTGGGWADDDSIPLVTYLTATFNKIPLGGFKAGDEAKFETEYSCSYVKQVLDGKDIIEFDPFNNVFKVGGEDQLAAFNIDLGTN